MPASRLVAAIMAGVLMSAPALSVAQEPPVLTAPAALPFRILDQDRLFSGSRMGQQILAEIQAEERALEAENLEIFNQLAAEERDLTERRASLSPDEFRALADAFDTRVETIRAERAARAQALLDASEQRAQQFFDAALPVLVQLMNDDGLVVLLKPDTLVLGLDALDITDRAIERLDAALGTTTP